MFTIKTPERRQWGRSGVFIVNFEHVIAGREMTYTETNGAIKCLKIKKMVANPSRFQMMFLWKYKKFHK